LYFVRVCSKIEKIIAIDIGNSTTAMGLFRKGELVSSCKIANRELCDTRSWLHEITEEAVCSGEEVTSVMIASVVPEKNEVFRRVIRSLYGLTPIFIGHELIRGAYPEMGPDRAASLLGASQLVGLPVCVVDFGTATTVDVLSEGGEYEGGVILPGIELGLASLSERTSLLPSVSASGKPPLLGRSTVECMESGAYWGEMSRIEGLLRRIKQGTNPWFVCTGGAGEVVARALSLRYEPWLTLWGLYYASRAVK
jgi:type III pantothenate kinase